MAALCQQKGSAGEAETRHNKTQAKRGRRFSIMAASLREGKNIMRRKSGPGRGLYDENTDIR